MPERGQSARDGGRLWNPALWIARLLVRYYGTTAWTGVIIVEADDAIAARLVCPASTETGEHRT